jgi:hypothetical protein
VPVTVSQLAIAPVKGMRLHGTSEIQIGQGEAWVDRGAAAQDAYRLMLRHHIAPELRELGFRRVASGTGMLSGHCRGGERDAGCPCEWG